VCQRHIRASALELNGVVLKAGGKLAATVGERAVLFGLFGPEEGERALCRMSKKQNLKASTRGADPKRSYKY